MLEPVGVWVVVYTLPDLTGLVSGDKNLRFILGIGVFKDGFQVPLLSHSGHVCRESHRIVDVVVVVVVDCLFRSGAVTTTVCAVGGGGVV